MKILKTTSVILSLVLFLAIGCEKNTQIKPTLDKGELKSAVIAEKSFDLYASAYYNNSIILGSLSLDMQNQLKTLANNYAKSQSKESTSALVSFNKSIGFDYKVIDYLSDIKKSISIKYLFNNDDLLNCLSEGVLELQNSFLKNSNTSRIQAFPSNLGAILCSAICSIAVSDRYKDTGSTEALGFYSGCSYCCQSNCGAQ